MDIQNELYKSLEILICQVICLLAVGCTVLTPERISVEQMTTNGRTDPLGIAADDVSFSWAIGAAQRGVAQNAYRIRMGTTEGGDDVWDSGRVASDRQIDIVFPAGLRLTPATRYYWQVRIWDGDNISSGWSEPAWFETGLLSAADWSDAEWIARQIDRINVEHSTGLPLLRGVFHAHDEVKIARIYTSACGLYELSLNGNKVGNQFLAPGWTDYNQRIQAQTYDVTEYVKKGPNVLGAALADGWYRGNVGLRWSHVYDDTGVGWSDAFITVPYAVWRATGDTRIIRRNWEAMQHFYHFIHDSATKDGNLLEEGRSSWFSGDWLNLEGVDRLEEHKVIATAYFAENTRMMAEMSEVMGDNDQASKWAALVPQIRETFVNAYLHQDGSIYMGTQTVYAMALGMDLIADPVLWEKTASKFIKKLADDNYHLKTGFLGTPWLLPALTRIGRDDLAMRLLLNKDYPSWGFEVCMGATTMWERWDSIRADGEFGPVDMNSFNHYAYGAVADWMFAHLGGLQILEPGYKKTRIAPFISYAGLDHAQCSLRTPYGLLASEWKLSTDKLTLMVTVPVNTTAEVIIPTPNAKSVYEGEALAVSAPGVKTAEFKDDQLMLLIGSGHYEFIVYDIR